MHLGRLLCGPTEQASRVRTDWTARAADNAVMTVELIHAIDADISVVVMHKNANATGPGTSAGASAGPSGTPGLHSHMSIGLEELVCFEVEVQEDAGRAMGPVLYRFLPATWFDMARAAGAP